MESVAFLRIVRFAFLSDFAHAHRLAVLSAWGRRDVGLAARGVVLGLVVVVSRLHRRRHAILVAGVFWRAGPPAFSGERGHAVGLSASALLHHLVELLAVDLHGSGASDVAAHVAGGGGERGRVLGGQAGHGRARGLVFGVLAAASWQQELRQLCDFFIHFLIRID